MSLWADTDVAGLIKGGLSHKTQRSLSVEYFIDPNELIADTRCIYLKLLPCVKQIELNMIIF